MSLNHEIAWKQCLDLIRIAVSENEFNTWFEPIIPLKLDGNKITIQVPTMFFFEWIENTYVKHLRKALDEVLGPNSKLDYSIIVDKGNQTAKPISMNLPIGAPNRPAVIAPVQKHYANESEISSPFRTRNLKPSDTEESQLNPSQSFENFVIGDCNRFAHGAAIAVAANPGHNPFNPLLLYGGVGLGKTHLVQAIGNRIKDVNPDKFVLYITTEKFTTQFVDAVSRSKGQDFVNFYMQVDVLILDDIQFLAGKEKTQDILFNIFNHLHQRQRQIILTSDCPPKELTGMHERLSSRFKWGLTADIQLPDFETRIAIIQKKMRSDGVDIPFDVCEFLAQSVKSNIRELEGVLVSLIAHASISKREFDINLAKQILDNMVENIETKIDIDYIQQAVSEYYSVSTNDLKAKSKKKDIVIPRMVAMYFARELTKVSLEGIGSFFGGRHHTTVLNAIDHVRELIQDDTRFKSDIEKIKRKFVST